MTTLALIVAAGRGVRAGSGLPKQYRPLGGKPVLRWSLEAFAAHPGIDSVLVAIAPEHAALFDAAADGAPKVLKPVFGGKERQETVFRALSAVEGRTKRVLIHDAARPFVSADVITRALEALDDHEGGCVALPVVDTLRREDGGECGELVSREGLWRAQTPQAFHFSAILNAHERFRDHPVTDDAELARLAGLSVALVEGELQNHKLTTPQDFDWAERHARAFDRREAAMEFRTGQGFDVHKFGPNADGSTDHVMLCGLPVAHTTGLVGHSDADVGLHAITDAVLGALGAGDIGAHFPPSDPKWKAAASDQFLSHAGNLVSDRGGVLVHVDVTLICEHPKIGPHVAAMKKRIGEILKLEADRVSVKATTSEGLGFTGRGEGIAALATATVKL